MFGSKGKDKTIAKLKEQIEEYEDVCTIYQGELNDLHNQLLTDNGLWSKKLQVATDKLKTLELENKNWAALISVYRTRHPEEFTK